MSKVGKKLVVAGNWKMHKGPQDAAKFFHDFFATNLDTQNQILFFVPALAAQTTSGALSQHLAYACWGLQNVHHENQGAFTGENSPQVAAEMGAKYGLVGHSERRQFFADTDEWTAKKVSALQKNGLTPVLCVGETQAERDQNQTQAVVSRQLRAGLQGADPAQRILIAYEPVWAIGTGRVATAAQAEEVHVFIRGLLREWLGPEANTAADATPILYGGSVKPENAAELASQKNIDGFLVGGASLEPATFRKLCEL